MLLCGILWCPVQIKVPGHATKAHGNWMFRSTHTHTLLNSNSYRGEQSGSEPVWTLWKTEKSHVLAGHQMTSADILSKTEPKLLHQSFCALWYIKTLVMPTNAEIYNLCILSSAYCYMFPSRCKLLEDIGAK